MNKRHDVKEPSTVLWQVRVTKEEDRLTDLLLELNATDRSKLIRGLIRAEAEERSGELAAMKRRKQRTRA